MIRFPKQFLLVLFCLTLALTFFAVPSNAAPLTANYFLEQLPSDADSLKRLSNYDVLILTPAQIATHPTAIAQIRALHANIIILAYVPSQSYNELYWHTDPVFKLLPPIKSEWWLRDASGHQVSTWTGILNINMSHEWSDALVDFAEQKIMSLPGVDGIFFDMVSHNISWANNGNIDLNNDGVKDSATDADQAWLERTRYLLQRARSVLVGKYVIINGSSEADLPTAVNGRMFETFPTPWEGDGNWATVMNRAKRELKLHAHPAMLIFNSNTNNTGNEHDYRQMRFGLTSSLLLDHTYNSFDYGTSHHGELWWYDEYNTNLGQANGDPVSSRHLATFAPDVWQRQYTHGVAVVNATPAPETVKLGGEYEKINGTQDRSVNNGMIVDNVKVGSMDGIVLLKTFQTVDNVVYANGRFLRFFDAKGNRVRNGFFSYHEQIPGGALIYTGDINNDGEKEQLVFRRGRLTITSASGDKWFDDTPFSNSVQNGHMVVGQMRHSDTSDIVLSADGTGEVVLYNYHGELQQKGFYPLGKKFIGNMSVAVGNVDGKVGQELVVGSENGKQTEVRVYDTAWKKQLASFFPYGKNTAIGAHVAVGDINGDGRDEIITISDVSAKPEVRIFDGKGKLLSHFTVGALFGARELGVAVTDVDFDGKADVVVMSE